MPVMYSAFGASFKRQPSDVFEQRWVFDIDGAWHGYPWRPYNMPEPMNYGGKVYVCLICGEVYARQYVRVNGVPRHRFSVVDTMCPEHDEGAISIYPLGLLCAYNGVPYTSAPAEVLMHDLLLWHQHEKRMEAKKCL